MVSTIQRCDRGAAVRNRYSTRGLSYAVYQKARLSTATCAECNLDHIKRFRASRMHSSRRAIHAWTPSGYRNHAIPLGGIQRQEAVAGEVNESPATNDSWTDSSHARSNSSTAAR